MSGGAGLGYRLGIDFGTSTTVGVLRRPDGDVRPLLIDGSPLLPSAVYAAGDGRLLVGRDAVHAARSDPSRLENSPKRRIGDGTVLLGDRELDAVDLVAAVLGRVGEEANRVAGGALGGLTLTHPAAWASTRRGLLTEAARRAGLPSPRLVPEPVAAASYFTEVLRHAIPAGSAVVVYDFGAGTFDASAVIRGAAGFETAVVDGLDDVGGLDVDAAVVEHLGTWYTGHDPVGWQRLTKPASAADRQARQEFWADARTCKEQLSRAASAEVAVVPLGLRTHLTREEFNELARPLVDQTVHTTLGVLRHANLRPDQVAGVFLVGGSSRIPLVAAELHRQLGIAPTIIEQPELVVAEGSVRLPADRDDGHGTRIMPVLSRSAAPPAPAQRSPAVAPVPVSPGPTNPMRVSPAPTRPMPAPTRPMPAAPAAFPVSPAGLPPRPVSGAGARPVSGAGGRPAAGAGPVPPGGRNGMYQTGGRGRKSRRGLAMTLTALVVLALLGGIGWYALQSDASSGNGAAAGTSATLPPKGWQTYYTSKLTTSDKTWWHDNSQDDNTQCAVTPDGLKVTKVRRTDPGNKTGELRCNGPQLSFTDVAIRTTAKVGEGCAAMWLRTGDQQGYFLDACAKKASLYWVGATDPSAQNMLGSWPLPKEVTTGTVSLGLLARGSTLTVFAGNQAEQPVHNTRIASGLVDLGAYTGENGNNAEVTYQRVTVWKP